MITLDYRLNSVVLQVQLVEERLQGLDGDDPNPAIVNGPGTSPVELGAKVLNKLADNLVGALGR